MYVKVVEVEFEVLLVMVEVLCLGNISVKDYYNLKNIEVDIGMRNVINKWIDQSDDELFEY